MRGGGEGGSRIGERCNVRGKVGCNVVVGSWIDGVRHTRILVIIPSPGRYILHTTARPVCSEPQPTQPSLPLHASQPSLPLQPIPLHLRHDLGHDIDASAAALSLGCALLFWADQGSSVLRAWEG